MPEIRMPCRQVFPFQKSAATAGDVLPPSLAQALSSPLGLLEEHQALGAGSERHTLLFLPFHSKTLLLKADLGLLGQRLLSWVICGPNLSLVPCRLHSNSSFWIESMCQTKGKRHCHENSPRFSVHNAHLRFSFSISAHSPFWRSALNPALFPSTSLLPSEVSFSPLPSEAPVSSIGSPVEVLGWSYKGKSKPMGLLLTSFLLAGDPQAHSISAN